MSIVYSAQMSRVDNLTFSTHAYRLTGGLLPQLVPCTNKGSTVYREICEEVSGDIYSV